MYGSSSIKKFRLANNISLLTQPWMFDVNDCLESSTVFELLDVMNW